MYSKTTWVNGQEPALSAENLNHIEDGLSEASYTADVAYSYARGALQESALAMTNSNNALEKAEASAEAVKNNIVYDKVNGISPITFGSLPGSVEVALKGNCAQIAYSFVDGGWEGTGGYKDASSEYSGIVGRSTNAFPCANGDTVSVSYNGKVTPFKIRIVTFNGETFVQRKEVDATSISFSVSGFTRFYIQWLTSSHYAREFASSDFSVLVNGFPAQPIPTPGAPIPIEYAHANDSTNLFDEYNVTRGKILNDQGQIVVPDNLNTILSDLISVKPNTNYVLSFNRLVTLSYTRIFGYDVSGNIIGMLVKRTDLSVGKETNAFKTQTNCAYIRFSTTSDGNSYMLNEGTSALPYESYYKTTNVESVGKNLLVPILATQTYHGISCTNNGDGTFTFSGTSTSAGADFALEDFRFESVFGYKLFGTPKETGNDAYLFVQNYGVDKGDGLDVSGLSGNKIIGFFVEGNKTINLTIKPYLIKSTEHDSIPLPADLLGLPGAQDKLADGIVTKAVSKITLDSSVEFAYINGCFQTPGAFPSDLGDRKFGMSDMFKFEYHESGITGYLSVNAFGWNDTNKLTIRVNGITSGADFAAWLDEHKPTIVYAIEYPYAMPLPPGTKQTIQTYEEQTTITADYCDISVEAAKNVLDVIDERTKKVYSSEPRVVGKWFDGRDVLEVDFYNEGAWQDIDVAYLGIDLCVDVGGILYSSNASPLPYFFSNGNYSLPYYDGNAKKIKNLIGAEMAVAVRGCRIMIQYVKASASGRSAEPMMLSEVEELTEN